MIVLITIKLIVSLVCLALCVVNLVVNDINYRLKKSIYLGLIIFNSMLVMLEFISGNIFSSLVFLLCTVMWTITYKDMASIDNDKINSIGKKE